MSLYNNVWLLNSIKLVSKGTCNLKEWLKIKVFEVPASLKLGVLSGIINCICLYCV